MDIDAYLRRDPIADRGISIVMPAWNEAENLELAVTNASEAMERLGRGHEIIVVDDGSTDATAEVAARVAASNRRFRLVRHDSRRGYGAALRSGFHEAKYPLVMQIDADGQYDASDVTRLLAAIDQVDIVCGVRERSLRSLGGRLGYWLYRRFVRAVFGGHVRDVDCGFRLYRRAALRRIPIQSTGRFANAEILAKATFISLLVGEAPVSFRARAAGCGVRPRESLGQVLREAGVVFRRPQWHDAAVMPARGCEAGSQ
jgi:glycosyltransferase involved in cell wall biosynthesis